MSNEHQTQTVRITGEQFMIICTAITTHLRPVLAANSLVKRELFSLPDPFAVVSVDADQTYTTSPVKRSLSPAWNQHFDM